MGTKVLHLIDSAGVYGAERVVLTLLEEFKNSEFPGILGCIRERENELPEIGKEAEQCGIPVQYFTMKRGFNPFGVYSISRFIRDSEIRIVHSHGYKPNIFLGVISKKNFKAVSTVHGWAKKDGGPRGRIYEILDSLALRRMDCVVAVSKGVEGDLIQKGIGIRKEKIELIYNGININFCRNTQGDISRIREQYKIPNNSFVIGTIGRLARVKGHSFLIKAMPSILKGIPNCKLVIAGEGPLRTDLDLEVKRLNLSDAVKFVGYIKNIEYFLSIIDLFVLPSLSEGLPISLLETLAFGKPVLASAVGGIPEVITNGNEGVLIPPGDSDSISKAIKNLFLNAEQMKKLSSNGRKIVQDRFSSTEMARQYITLYATLSD